MIVMGPKYPFLLLLFGVLGTVQPLVLDSAIQYLFAFQSCRSVVSDIPIGLYSHLVVCPYIYLYYKYFRRKHLWLRTTPII